MNTGKQRIWETDGRDGSETGWNQLKSTSYMTVYREGDKMFGHYLWASSDGHISRLVCFSYCFLSQLCSLVTQTQAGTHAETQALISAWISIYSMDLQLSQITLDMAKKKRLVFCLSSHVFGWFFMLYACVFSF